MAVVNHFTFYTHLLYMAKLSSTLRGWAIVFFNPVCIQAGGIDFITEALAHRLQCRTACIIAQSLVAPGGSKMVRDLKRGPPLDFGCSCQLSQNNFFIRALVFHKYQVSVSV